MSIFPRLMGIVPAGVGISLLFFVWGGGMDSPLDDRMGGTPFFFKLFFSFVALAFTLFGAALIIGPSLLKGQRENLVDTVRDLADAAKGSASSQPDAPPKVGYNCPNCGSDLGEDAEVSPSGDAKCQYCKRWFNIHA